MKTHRKRLVGHVTSDKMQKTVVVTVDQLKRHRLYDKVIRRTYKYKAHNPGDVAKTLHRGGPTERQTNTLAAFKAGDKVRAKNINPLTHTRLPRYVRGHIGTIERVIGCHVFPDSNATGAGENPQWLYTVRFDGRELWGADGDPTMKVSVDAWEPYLEPA